MKKFLYIILSTVTISYVLSCTEKVEDIPPTPPPGTQGVPTILSFTPQSATSGDTILITGTNFTGATVVTLGQAAVASFIIVSNTKIKAIVSNGATGNVVVSTTQGSASSAGFTFLSTNNVPKWLLTKWTSDNPQTLAINFEYDATKKLSRIYYPNHEAFIFFKNDTISHAVLKETDIYNGNAVINYPVIFSYDINKNCKKVFYKMSINNVADNDPYLSDTTDNRFTRIDSLAYSSTNQLLEIWGKYNVSTPIPPSLPITSLVKFTYPNLQSETPDRLQTYYFPFSSTAQEEMNITVDTSTNPIYKLGWFLPYFRNVRLNSFSFITPSFTPEYNSSGPVPAYLSMVKKCVKKYSYNSFTGSPYSFSSGTYKQLYTNGLLSRTIFDQAFDPTLPMVYYYYDLL